MLWTTALQRNQYDATACPLLATTKLGEGRTCEVGREPPASALELCHATVALGIFRPSISSWVHRLQSRIPSLQLRVPLEEMTVSDRISDRPTFCVVTPMNIERVQSGIAPCSGTGPMLSDHVDIGGRSTDVRSL